ncbi:hypothetical protein BBJ28_00019043 [Nothophytophthora sp. Chile5]|nr:hypothetical protein BBJ28_00019043 [Nothophytophthora sp. Chile5]
MSELLTVMTPDSTPRVAYAIQVDGVLSPQVVVPCTPDAADASNGYKQMATEGFEIASGRWSVGFFDCFQHCVPNTLMATLCPCISLAQITGRLGMAPYYTALLFFVLLSAFEVTTIAFSVQQYIEVAVLGHSESSYYYHAHRIVVQRSVVNPVVVSLAVIAQMVFCISVWRLRKQIRTQFRIPGAIASDCLAAVFCPCCTTVQMASHVKSFTPGSCAFGPADTLPSYQ